MSLNWNKCTTPISKPRTHMHTHMAPVCYTPFHKLARQTFVGRPAYEDHSSLINVTGTQSHFQLLTVCVFQSAGTIHSHVRRWAVKSSAVVIPRMPFLFKGASRACRPAGQCFSNTASPSLCWGSRDPKSRSLFPRRSVLHVTPTLKQHPPTKAAAVPVYDMTKASQIKWRLTKGREKRRMFHSNIPREFALFTCVGLLLHGRYGTETTPGPVKHAGKLCFILA